VLSRLMATILIASSRVSYVVASMFKSLVISTNCIYDNIHASYISQPFDPVNFA